LSLAALITPWIGLSPSSRSGWAFAQARKISTSSCRVTGLVRQEIGVMTSLIETAFFSAQGCSERVAAHPA
jgi:hypothetical protein